MKKILVIGLMSLTFLGLVGCGKKNNSISENLVNDNPGVIVYDESLVTPMNTSTEEYEGIIPGSELISGDIYNEDGSMSDNSVSDNELGEYEGNASSQEAETTGEAETIPMTYDAYVAANSMANKPLTICNTSGKNIDKLYVSFSVANMSNLEVLGSNVLKDGEVLEYDILDKEALKGNSKIALSIVAESGKDTIDFGIIDIVDPSDMVIVLGTGSTGYCLFLE